jgi:cytosylglucuronate decarboxylase
LLEACNADCFMCGYALSRDRYRFSVEDFASLLPQARAMGVDYVRFTGGEPLLHRQVVNLVSAGAEAGMKMSLITNGSLLPAMIERLAHAGLAQVIVSIDGATAASHDYYRNTPGLFDKGVAGLAQARDHGVMTRVNTVVGPHNYREMPDLQRRLTDLEVAQWELSAIKLERFVAYDDRLDVERICDAIHDADPDRLLVPLGKRFCGNSPDERQLFFEQGITPRPSLPRCNLVGDVIYIDAKSGVGFGCSLLPHRDADESGGGVKLRTDGVWRLEPTGFERHVEYFREAGPTLCRGCSTTAAGYSDSVGSAGTASAWQF